MTDRSNDPYFDMRSGSERSERSERAELDEPERGAHEATLDDPARRAVPFVEGPTGASPLASELRSDPEEDGDRRGEKGAMGGVLAGTAVAGPIGGVIGGVVGATAGAAAEDDEVRDARLEAGDDAHPEGT